MLTRTLCASALLAVAGAALAEPQSEERVRVREVIIQQDKGENRAGVFRRVNQDQHRDVRIERTNDVVLVFSPAPNGGTNASFTDGRKAIKLRVDGDTVRDLEVVLDGQRAAGHRATIENGKIFVLAPSGEAIAEFQAPKGVITRGEGNHAFTWHAQPQGSHGVARLRAAGEEERLARVMSEMESRRVIGISASNPGEALAAQLGLEPGKVIVVDSVTDGLPAAKAGLKRYDIITGIDGDPPATIQRLRDVIVKKSANEPLRLTVLRGGKSQTIEVVPAPEREIEEVTLELSRDRAARGAGRFNFFDIEENLTEDQRRAVEEAMAKAQAALESQRERMAELHVTLEGRLQDMSARLQEQLTEEGAVQEIRQAYEQAIREMSSVDVQRQIEQALAQVRQAVGQVDVERELRRLPRIEFLERENNGRGVIVAPAAPSAPRAPAAPRALRAPDDSRLEALEERMERIERLLERLVDDRDR